MKVPVLILLLMMMAPPLWAQLKSVAQIKADIERSGNGPLYVKDILKKKFVIDTIVIRSTQQFYGLPDSLAYHGKVGKVYGPYQGGKTLVQILAKSPTTFNHPGQIFIDTSVFSKRFADSLSDDIIKRIRAGAASFEDMARTYSMGGEAKTNGDLGWVATGYMMPQIEKALARCKKGDMFKIWTANGVHIIRKLDESKQDHGYVLLLRIFL
ncbi:peptidylprolyl isomerase [Paraflavitalea sp. CAU 1676]|uniref:peptidylprolyl isomerase n=1 Tax=Paraflavitalea sp. CAU 1676 TaxID=3032598 RepID=UPI0023DAC5C7|nr:peptidylprolyl isomerase [Paraflavitalea sp. CAU 1676]MDF2190111.1 peptidylprolyl isomerase [Paraflavitalea sp. CAU 1676]